MSNVVLLEPHYDDAILFASYTLLREQPKVITVLGSDTVQWPAGITSDRRAGENWRAMEILLGSPDNVVAWGHSERAPDWGAVRLQMTNEMPWIAWVPLPEPDGHEHHNALAELAIELWGDRVRFYATYSRGSGRTRTETEVIPDPDWPARKYAAMACFSSQINLENTRPWFCSDDCLREWIA